MTHGGPHSLVAPPPWWKCSALGREDSSNSQGCVCVHIPKFVCLFLPGYSCVNTEAHVTVCSPGWVSCVSGLRFVWNYIVVCALGSDPGVFPNRGSRAGIHVCGPVLCRYLHATACASVHTGVDKKCVFSSVLAFVHGCARTCVLRGRWAQELTPLYGGAAGSRSGVLCVLGEMRPREAGGWPGSGRLPPHLRAASAAARGARRAHSSGGGNSAAAGPAAAIRSTLELTPRDRRCGPAEPPEGASVGGRGPVDPRRPGAPAPAAGRPHATDGEDPGPVHHRAGRHA